jgi:hypothetical protein
MNVERNLNYTYIYNSIKFKLHSITEFSDGIRENWVMGIDLVINEFKCFPISEINIYNKNETL